MAIEIEAKFRVEDPRAVREKLLAAGARELQAVLEHDSYFDTPDQCLRRSDRGLRVRSVETPDGRRKTFLTYKGPRRPGELKIRQEEQVALSCPQAATAILAGLGYRPTLAFQKRRRGFELSGARVELDELPELGFFLEIEADDEQTVRKVRTRLGLEGEPTITSPYVALVAEHLAAAGNQTRRLNFR